MGEKTDRDIRREERIVNSLERIADALSEIAEKGIAVIQVAD